MKKAISVFLLVAATASAKETVFPVVTGTTKDRVFVTTVQVENSATNDVQCSFSYAGPERVGKPLVSNETIPAGKTHVFEDFLAEIAAAGTVRVKCSGDVEIVARVQDSLDGGKTFRDGRTYRPFAIANLLTVNESRTVRTTVDLVLAEVAGRPVQVVVQAQNAAGVVFARKSYDIPPYAQRVVNFDAVRDKLSGLDVVISVPSGEGKIVIGKETRDPALAKVARRRSEATVEVVRVNAADATSITAQLLICPFKAAPFRDPATGLCFMRDRWYDPETGTFLTPDRMGYRDSSNLYIFGKGDPVNNSDPTGMYIDESNILSSRLKNKYVSWRDNYLKSPLGRQIWDRLDKLPANVFTLEMLAMAPQNSYTTGAETANFFDAKGVQNRATISFNERFGDEVVPDPANPLAYKWGKKIYDNDAGGFIQYAMGHEIGHVLGGWDPTMQPDTLQFATLGAQINNSIPAFNQLTGLSTPTPLQQQQLTTLKQNRTSWYRQQTALKQTLEPYADDFGLQIYRSYRQANPRWLGLAPVGGKVPPTLAPTVTSHIPP